MRAASTALLYRTPLQRGWLVPPPCNPTTCSWRASAATQHAIDAPRIKTNMSAQLEATEERAMEAEALEAIFMESYSMDGATYRLELEPEVTRRTSPVC